MKNIIIGLLFAVLWASASAATKIGLQSGEPFIIAECRFFIAAAIMLFWAHAVRRHRLPTRDEWRPLAIYGLLNVAIYLGLYVLAMQEISAGIGSLSVATSPLMISILSALWLGRRIQRLEIAALLFGFVGIGLATYPLLLSSYASLKGIFLVLAGMVAYSMGTVFYARERWDLPSITINAWQILFGGVFLLPLAVGFSDLSKTHFDLRFWGSIAWLVIPVSIGAVQLWLYLLKIDAVKASLWLFLCPIAGFVIAHFLLDEPITIYTYVGTAAVIVGLYLGQKSKTQIVLKEDKSLQVIEN